jgi:monofunctional glycosyltransferase
MPPAKKTTRHPGARTFRRVAVGIAAILVVLVGAPYVIAPFYRVVMPVSMPMLWRRLTGERVERIVVPLARIAPALPLAVVGAEDGSFCHNPGIDLGAIRAVLRNSDDLEEARGASTLTQQVAKNLFLWQGHSFVRKALEIPLALWLNLVLPKRRAGNLSEHRRVGSERRIRRRSSLTVGVRQVGPRSERAGGRHAGGNPA